MKWKSRLSLKQLVRRSVQKIYQKVAPPNMTLFELLDTADPLFGSMTGIPIDRILISDFLEKESNKNNPQAGDALEVGGLSYIKKYWPNLNANQLNYKENISLKRVNSNQIFGDLRILEFDFTEKFDLICFTQVLNFIDEFEKALSSINQLLSKNGKFVATFPFLTPLSIYDDSRWGEWKRFTHREVIALATNHFPNSEIKVSSIGNAVTSAALILGIPSERIDSKYFSFNRPSHATLIGLTVSKHDVTETSN